MAFDIKNVMSISNRKSGASGIPSIFAFYNSASDTVTDAGFIPANVGIKEGDQVMVIDADYGNNVYYNATVTTGVITLLINS